MLSKLLGNTALKTPEKEVFPPDVGTVHVADFDTMQAANGENTHTETQKVQSPTQDRRDNLEDRYNNHNLVKQNVLLRAKVNHTELPEAHNEKQMRKVFDGVVRDFGLEDGDLSYEHFKLIASDCTEKEFRAELIETLPAEKLEMANNMHPTKAEMNTIESLPLAYEHADIQTEMLNEMQVLDREEAERYHAQLEEDLKSPTDQYIAIQTELDEIGALEEQREQAVQEVSSQSIGGTFDDKVAYLFDNPQAALDRADKMMDADTKVDAMQFVDANAGRDALQGFEEGVDETFRDTDMKSTISGNFEVLGEANMKGGQDLTGGDNDLRKLIKRDVASGTISQETVELQAAEEVGLDEEMLARKQDLETQRDGLLEDHGADIAADITSQRADLGLEPMEINSPESLSLAVQDMQTELEKRKDLQRSDEPEISF